MSIPNTTNYQNCIIYNVSDFSTWLNKKFLDWQYNTGERQTLKAFARYLDVKTTTLSSWLNDDVPPTGDNLYKVADKLGFEIYDLLDVPPPTPQFVHEMKTTYNALPAEQQPEFQEDLERFLAEWLTEHGFKRVK